MRAVGARNFLLSSLCIICACTSGSVEALHSAGRRQSGDRLAALAGEDAYDKKKKP